MNIKQVAENCPDDVRWGICGLESTSSTGFTHGSKLYCVLTQTEAKMTGSVVAARRAALAGEKQLHLP